MYMLLVKQLNVCKHFAFETAHCTIASHRAADTRYHNKWPTLRPAHSFCLLLAPTTAFIPASRARKHS